MLVYVFMYVFILYLVERWTHTHTYIQLAFIGSFPKFLKGSGLTHQNQQLGLDLSITQDGRDLMLSMSTLAEC